MRAMLTFDHVYVRYSLWKLWHGLDLSGVSADRLGFDASLRGHANTGGPRLAGILRRLRLSEMWSAVDIGSGKGGACFTLARFFHSVRGIELSPILMEVAKANQRKLGARVRNITFVQEDARFADYDKFQLFYMANPFGSEVARAVLAKIEESLERLGREAVLVVYHPCKIDEWIQPKRFKLSAVHEFRNQHPIYIFKTQ